MSTQEHTLPVYNIIWFWYAIMQNNRITCLMKRIRSHNKIAVKGAAGALKDAFYSFLGAAL